MTLVPPCDLNKLREPSKNERQRTFVRWERDGKWGEWTEVNSVDTPTAAQIRVKGQHAAERHLV